MLIKDMLNMSREEWGKELEDAEARVKKLSGKVRGSENPAHTGCRYYNREGDTENCRALRWLYCKEEEYCSFEGPREEDDEEAV